jgi:hypothetical protein
MRHSLQSLKSGLGILPVGQAKQSAERSAGMVPLVTGRTAGQRVQGTWPVEVAIPKYPLMHTAQEEAAGQIPSS